MIAIAKNVIVFRFLSHYFVFVLLKNCGRWFEMFRKLFCEKRIVLSLLNHHTASQAWNRRCHKHKRDDVAVDGPCSNITLAQFDCNTMNVLDWNCAHTQTKIRLHLMLVFNISLKRWSKKKKKRKVVIKLCMCPSSPYLMIHSLSIDLC